MAIHENTVKLISSARLRKGFFLALAVTCVMAWSLSLWAMPDDEIAYPAGYRQWTRVKSTIIGPKSSLYQQIGGIQHIYANEKGMEGYRTGSFPEGSILVYDFLKTEEDDNNPGVVSEGSRRFT